MSQVATFTYLKIADLPLLGFWSKPKARLFRSPLFHFSEFLSKREIRSSVFVAGDGLYVAVAFAWFSQRVPSFVDNADPVLHTIRRNTGDSYWLFSYKDKDLSAHFDQSLSDKEWQDFHKSLNLPIGVECPKDAVEAASKFVKQRINELQHDEALLVSVG